MELPEARAEQLVRDYADLVTRIGYTWFGNPYDAQDICQTVLLRLMTRPGLPEAPENARRWVVRVAVNECKNLKRSAWFRRTVALDDGLGLSVELPEDGGEVLAAVQKLPLKYREPVYLHYYEGYSVAEIADLLGQRPNLVSTHLARARAKLKPLLGGEYHVKEPV